ncbi:MAG: IPT/TIG domain-containing protein [Acidobacteriota bacterium]
MRTSTSWLAPDSSRQRSNYGERSLSPGERRENPITSGLIRVAVLSVAFIATVPVTLHSQPLTGTQIAPAGAWEIRRTTTSGGQVLYVAGDVVYLFDGTTIHAVTETHNAGDTVAQHVLTLGSDAIAGQVIGGWRRGNGYSNISINGAAALKVNVNPESVSIDKGCAFFVLQDPTVGQQAYQVDPVTLVRTQLSTSITVGRIVADGCKAAWSWQPTNTSPSGIQYWDGSAMTTLETDAGLAADIQPFRRGQLVYVKEVNNIPQVFVVDTTSLPLTPVQLSHETVATNLLMPATDGRHVAWWRGDAATGANAQLILNGDLVFPTGPIGALAAIFEMPFQLDRGQLLWKSATGAHIYDNGKQTFLIQSPPGITFSTPWLNDGYIAILGHTSDGQPGDVVSPYRITVTPPDDSSQPSPPLLVTTTSATGQVTVRWDPILGATSYNLYMASGIGAVTKDNYGTLPGGRMIANVTNPVTVTSLPTGVYSFAITALTGATEGPSSRVATAFPAWQAVGGFTATNFQSVAANQTNASFVYAGSNGSVYKSADGGITWTQVLPAATTAANTVAALAVNGTTVFANMMTGADVWKGVTNGTTWTRVLDATGFGEQAGALAINPVTPATMYAADFILPGKTSAQSMVIKSLDGGTTWAHTAQGPPGDEIHGYALAIDPVNSATIYAAGTGTPNIVKSIDGGASWTNIPIAAVGPVYSLAIDPTNTNIIYATSRDYGVFKSLNGGTTWAAYNAGLTGVANGVTVVSGAGFNSILVDPQNPNILHLGAGNGYWYSLDAGMRWTAANDGFGASAPYIYALAMTPAGRLIAATNNGLFLLSLGALTVTSVTPNSGAPAGGTSVTIAGTGFQAGATVTFGGGAATNVVVVSTTSITATTPAHAAGAVSVAVTNNDTTSAVLANGFTYSSTPPAAPSGVIAAAQSATSVLVTWNTTATATSYQVFRQAPSVAFAPIGSPTASTSFTDSTATANTSYLYRVRAINAAGSSGDSSSDIATTIIFTNDPLVAGVTVIKAVHLAELRAAVNAVRALAGAGAFSFITGAGNVGTTVTAAQINEIRTALDGGRSPLGLSTGGYTDTLNSSVRIKAVHFQEIRGRVK